MILGELIPKNGGELILSYDETIESFKFELSMSLTTKLRWAQSQSRWKRFTTSAIKLAL